MDLLNRLAEEKIAEAVRRGDLYNLPNAGQPLQLEDLSLVPETLRPAYLLLKNSGYLPPELRMRREIADAESLLVRCDCQESRLRQTRKLNFLRIQLGLLSGILVDVEERYQNKLNKRLE